MAYDPTNGEAPLPDFKHVDTTGGSDQAAQEWAFIDFKKQFGRNPTQSELNMLSPSYSMGDPNKLDLGRGKQTIAQYFQNQSNTPDQINKQNQEKYLKDAPQHFDSVNKMFQDQFGRAASQEELNHFGSLLASGTTDQYQLGQFLQQQPEAAQRNDRAFQDQLSGQLQGYDKRYFSENILPSIQETYAKQGRSFDSSAFQNAATQSAAQQNTGREQYLAQLSASQYGGRQQNAYNDYANMVANQQGLVNSGIQAQYQGLQNTQNRVNQISDYNTQQQAYNEYLAKYGKRNNGLGGLIGTAAGAALGSFGGIKGAQLGATLGGAVGQGAQNAYGGSY